MEPRWYSLWYSGRFRSLKNIWREWHTRVTEFFDQSGLTITHFGADSPSFHSGKYLDYSRGRKRLVQAFEKGEKFDHLGFLEMLDKSFNTLAGDNSFHVMMTRKGVEVDVRLDRHNQDLCDRFRNVAEQFFRSARLITFKTPRDLLGLPCNLPCNLPANYDREGSDIEADYIDIKVEHIGSKAG